MAAQNSKQKQTVNLFLSLPKIAGIFPTVQQIIYVWLGVIVLAIIFQIFLLFHHDSVKTEGQSIRQELAAMLHKIGAISQTDPGSKKGNKLVGVIDEGMLLQDVNIYNYFHSLAKIHNNKVWLTNMSLDLENMAFKFDGVASVPAAMYDFSTRVKGSSVYAQDNLVLQDVIKSKIEETSVYKFSLTNIKSNNQRR